MAVGYLLLMTVAAAVTGTISAIPIAAQNSALLKARHVRRIFNSTAGDLLRHDQARAKLFRDRGNSVHGRRDGTFGVTNAISIYTAEVGVGSPATTYTLAVDTGSSNTWVGANKTYTPTSTSKNTGNTVQVSYGSGNFSGEEYTDTLTLGGITIPGQSIGVANMSQGFEGFDGILGVGPTELTEGTVSNTNAVPTVMDNLYSQRLIETETLGVYYAPAASSNPSGELSFGAVDYSKCTSAVSYVPITSTDPASAYWGIDQAISYGSQTILASTAGIVDAGTTLILIASDAYAKYMAATNAAMDAAVGLLTISMEQYNQLSDLNFQIGGNTYVLTANAQIWPRSLNSAIDAPDDAIYLVVNDIGSPSGSGLDFVNGYCFLERFYSVFDTTNSQVGFATTAQTNSMSN